MLGENKRINMKAKKREKKEKLVGNNMEVVTVIDGDNGITKQVGAL